MHEWRGGCGFSGEDRVVKDDWTEGEGKWAGGRSAASHGIRGLFGPDDPKATVRFSMGRSSSEADVSRAVAVLAEVVGRVRGLEEVS